LTSFKAALCLLSETVKIVVSLPVIPLSRYLVYLETDARNTSSRATGHVLAGSNLEELLAYFARTRKACSGGLSKGGTPLPENVDGFDEFEFVLRRAWEIQNNEPQRAERKMHLAIDSLPAANQSCRDPDDDKNAGPGAVSVVPDAQRRPKRES
jgi:hypothetical protein